MLEQIIFFALAAVAVLSALGVVFNKNVVHSALFLLLNFSTIAFLYFMLNAQFLGVAQILVYAGAIVVLFLFVVMLVGADVGEPLGNWLSGQNIFLMVLGLILLTVVGTAVFENTVLGAGGEMTPEVVAQFGQTEVIAAALFTQYTLPFQLVAVLLSVGVIGVVWLAQHQQRQKFRQVVAVLDAGWDGESQKVHHDKLRVNWLRRPKLFDFDWVEIARATDDDVARFTRQIENDEDRWRGLRYPQMVCVVSPECDLSESTHLKLRQMFGEVRTADVERGAQ
ncbi:MAG: NADH-quinone oxidoreductase subunit J [Chloroflexi bacterium]|nr:MAG: NADH-quinone oxidoreductase subunit J [Chloroflexota bacterium]